MPKEEVATSLDAKTMANDILRDRPLLLELRGKVSCSPTNPKDAVYWHLSFPAFLVVPAAKGEGGAGISSREGELVGDEHAQG